MLRGEGIGLAVLDRSDIVKAPWDHLNMELVWEHRASCNHSGHLQVVGPVNLEMDSSLPAAGHLEEDMRPDVLLLPSSCSFVGKKFSKPIESLMENIVFAPGLISAGRTPRSYDFKRLAPPSQKNVLDLRLM
jgi:hypothetical protein